MLPLYSNPDNILYTDVQGSYGQDDGSCASVGAGLRKQIDNSGVYGGYLFLDRNESNLHNVFTVLSPGIEAFLQDWDLRVNSYFPVSQRRRTVEFFPSAEGDYSYMLFTGHRQYEHRFTIFEEAGKGGDAELGYTFHHLNNTQIHAGVYTFNFKDSSNSFNYERTKNITGFEGRLEIPINPFWAAAVESNYDRYHHGTVVAGLRYNFFGSTPINANLHNHMIDPIARNLGSLNTGSGIPTVKNKHDDALVLQRDNIYFFTSQASSSIADSNPSGTFENPFRGDQFSQTLIDQIGENANFYFNSGNYVIAGAGNSANPEIRLLAGDSMYGRSNSFRSPATGLDRPLFLGEINLFQGDNTLDSIRLLSRSVDNTGAGSQVTALNIQNSSNVIISNSEIAAVAIEAGNLTGANFATGIYANNSQVHIENCTITASASVLGENEGSNFAAGIGANTVDNTASFEGNKFSLTSCSINASASVSGTNNESNCAVGIGANAHDGSASFDGNTFTLANTNVSATAATLGDNCENNQAAGIGANAVDSSVWFDRNTVTVSKSTINTSALVSGDNCANNISVGIGSNDSISSAADFNENQITLKESTLNAASVVHGENWILGCNESYAFVTNGNGNDIKITESTLNAVTKISEENLDTNKAQGISVSGTDNVTNIDHSNINVLAQTLGTNFGTNDGVGLTGFDSPITINNSIVKVTAQADGVNTATGKFGLVDDVNTQFILNQAS